MPLHKSDAQELLRQSAALALHSAPVECVTGKLEPRRPLSNAERLHNYYIRRGLHSLLQQLEMPACVA